MERVYHVFFAEENEDAIKRMKDAIAQDGWWELDTNSYLVRTAMTSQKLAETVGIKGEDRIVSGVVFRLNHIYSGYYDKGLWEWLATE